MTVVDDQGEATEVEVDVVPNEDGTQEAQVETSTETQDDGDPAAGIAALKEQIKAFEEREKARQQDLDNARKSIESARIAREDAERRAAQARNEARDTSLRAREAAYNSVVNALSAAQGALSQQKAAAQQAAIDNDWAKHAELSAEIGVTAARISQLEAGKNEFEADRGARPADRESEASISDQQEAFIRRLPPRSAAWVREHRERYFNDPSFQNMVAGAHQLAVGRGVQQDSDDYFRFIEEECGLRQRETHAAEETHQEHTPAPVATPKSPTSSAATSQPRRSPTPAAPAATGAPTSARSTGSSSVSISLTPEEREFCRLNEIPEANYAKQKKQLMDEQRLGPRAIH